MKIHYGNGTTEYGPGVNIELTGEEVVIAITHWLQNQGVFVNGPRTVSVNQELCRLAESMLIRAALLSQTVAAYRDADQLPKAKFRDVE